MPIKLPPTLLPTLAAIAGLLVVGAVVLFFGGIVATPRMSGTLTFTRNGRLLADVVLNGRRMKLVAPEGTTELVGVSGSLAGTRGSGRGQRAVRVNARLGGERALGLLADGDVLQMGDTKIAYITDRRRILSKIGLPQANP